MKLKKRLTNFWGLTLSSIVVCILLGTIQLSPTLAREVQLATSWQQASFPVENFQAYTSPYGYRISPSTGMKEFHDGLDIAAPLGSYIRSWWGGKIVKLSDNTACGTQITIQSGNWQHIYCHLNGYILTNQEGRYLVDDHKGVLLKEGQTVGTGDRIARIGMTGRTTGPHLHWSIRYNNQSIDPADILRNMYSQS